jgi:hypothetical protein
MANRYHADNYRNRCARQNYEYNAFKFSMLLKRAYRWPGAPGEFPVPIRGNRQIEGKIQGNPSDWGARAPKPGRRITIDLQRSMPSTNAHSATSAMRRIEAGHGKLATSVGKFPHIPKSGSAINLINIHKTPTIKGIFL